MIQTITSGVTAAISMTGQVISAIFGASGTEGSGSWSAVQDVIGLQIGMGVIGFAIVKIKSIVYGF